MSQSTTYPRFSASQRFEHFVLIIIFLGLVVTGIPQKYADQEWAKTTITVLGGIESIRIIHRALALVLLAQALYHLLVVSYGVVVVGLRASLVPNKGDLRDLRQWVMYSLGLNGQRPQMPYFNFMQKWDYWFTVLGIVVMGLTGTLMWNPVAATKLLPGEIIPTARVVHSGEALVLVIGIFTWHLYSAITSRNRSIFTGSLSHQQMVEAHGAVLTEEPFTPTPNTNRKSLFIPVAGVLAIAVLGGVVAFLRYEDGTLDTVPRQDEIIFLPQLAMPEAGDAALGESLWPTLRCARCHGDSATGTEAGPDLTQTTLSFEDFVLQVRHGRGEMPGISFEEISDGYLLHVYTWLGGTIANETSDEG